MRQTDREKDRQTKTETKRKNRQLCTEGLGRRGDEMEVRMRLVKLEAYAVSNKQSVYYHGQLVKQIGDYNYKYCTL